MNEPVTAGELEQLRQDVKNQMVVINALAAKGRVQARVIDVFKVKRAAVLALADEVEQGGIPGLVQAGPYRLASRLREVVGVEAWPPGSVPVDAAGP